MLRAHVFDLAGNSITTSPASYQILPSLDFSWNTSETNLDRLIVKPGQNSNYGAPHICVIVHMRGLLTPVYTRIYFSDEQEANSRDQILAQSPQNRRRSLIAQQKKSAENFYEFDIYMQGDQETVFFHL